MPEEDLKGVFAHDPELQEQVRKLLEEWDSLVDEVDARRLIDGQVEADEFVEEILKKLKEP